MKHEHNRYRLIDRIVAWTFEDWRKHSLTIHFVKLISLTIIIAEILKFVIWISIFSTRSQIHTPS